MVRNTASVNPLRGRGASTALRRVGAAVERADTADRDDRAAVGSLAPAVTRAVAILDALAAEPGRPMPLSELSRRVGGPKSSVANVCTALVDAGLVRRWENGFALG